jgi:hypothetical protein
MAEILSMIENTANTVTAVIGRVDDLQERLDTMLELVAANANLISKLMTRVEEIAADRPQKPKNSSLFPVLLLWFVASSSIFVWQFYSTCSEPCIRIPYPPLFQVFK